MIPCPHCGKQIKTESSKDTSWYQGEQSGTQVTLGCGTLILIALIVSFFSGNDSDSIRSLQGEIRGLETKIDALSRDLSQLSKKIQ